MTTERDPQTRLVLSWLREDAHENAERMLLRALDEVDATPQRRPWRPSWRDIRMNKLILAGATSIAVLVVAVIGYTLLPALGLGPGATPPPSPSLLARGSFDIRDWGKVQVDAIGAGFAASGRLLIGVDRGSGWPITVDLDCTRTTPDGLLMIGGHVTNAFDSGASSSSGPSLAAVVLDPGSPVRTAIWVGSVVNFPGTETTDCLSYLDAWLLWSDKSLPGRQWLRDDSSPTIEFGP